MSDNNEINEINEINEMNSDRYSYNNSDDNSYQWRPEEISGDIQEDMRHSACNDALNVAVKSQKKSKKEKKRISFGAAFAMCLSFALTVIIINTASLYYVFNYTIPENYIKKSDIKIGGTLDNVNPTGNMGTVSNKTEDNEQNAYSIKQVTKLVLPSVVAITSTSYITQGWNPFSHGYTYQVNGAGSGIIIGKSDTELFIVTNNHVVEGTSELTVEFVDGSSYTAYVKGTSQNVDIAVVCVKIRDISAETLAAIKIATLGNSDALTVGDGVVAIGNALGYGQSVTAGIVSALNREVTTESYKMNMIQTDAAINGGNSGGALINMSGEVIGINAAKSSSSSGSSSAIVEGMGYAIPISDVTYVIENIINQIPEEEKGYLGIVVIDVSQEDAEKYSLKVGINVNKVMEKSGAYKAGIYAGDVITAVNGREVSIADEMNEILSNCKAGEKVTLTILSNIGKGQYEEKTVEIELKSYNDIYS